MKKILFLMFSTLLSNNLLQAQEGVLYGKVVKCWERDIEYGLLVEHTNNIQQYFFVEKKELDDIIKSSSTDTINLQLQSTLQYKVQPVSHECFGINLEKADNLPASSATLSPFTLRWADTPSKEKSTQAFIEKMLSVKKNEQEHLIDTKIFVQKDIHFPTLEDYYLSLHIAGSSLPACKRLIKDMQKQAESGTSTKKDYYLTLTSAAIVQLHKNFLGSSNTIYLSDRTRYPIHSASVFTGIIKTQDSIISTIEILAVNRLTKTYECSLTYEYNNGKISCISIKINKKKYTVTRNVIQALLKHWEINKTDQKCTFRAYLANEKTIDEFITITKPNSSLLEKLKEYGVSAVRNNDDSEKESESEDTFKNYEKETNKKSFTFSTFFNRWTVGIGLSVIAALILYQYHTSLLKMIH